ncbi:MAG: hypothetical protein NTT76_14425, partial [Achromobacter xylosoxidans]|nr:hypothetical protein [Achromobacter xylosoxidans]
ADHDNRAMARRREPLGRASARHLSVAVCSAAEKKPDPSINDSFLRFMGLSPCVATMWATHKAGFERERACSY